MEKNNKSVSADWKGTVELRVKDMNVCSGVTVNANDLFILWTRQGQLAPDNRKSNKSMSAVSQPALLCSCVLKKKNKSQIETSRVREIFA